MKFVSCLLEGESIGFYQYPTFDGCNVVFDMTPPKLCTILLFGDLYLIVKLKNKTPVVITI